MSDLMVKAMALECVGPVFGPNSLLSVYWLCDRKRLSGCTYSMWLP